MTQQERTPYRGGSKSLAEIRQGEYRTWVFCTEEDPQKQRRCSYFEPGPGKAPQDWCFFNYCDISDDSPDDRCYRPDMREILAQEARE